MSLPPRYTPSEVAEADEKRWHGQFRHLRIRGEWFRQDDGLMRAVRKALGHPEPKAPRPVRPGVPLEWHQQHRALINQRNACADPVNRTAIQILIEQIESISEVGEAVMRPLMRRQIEVIAAL